MIFSFESTLHNLYFVVIFPRTMHKKGRVMVVPLLLSKVIASFLYRCLKSMPSINKNCQGLKAFLSILTEGATLKIISFFGARLSYIRLLSSNVPCGCIVKGILKKMDGLWQSRTSHAFLQCTYLFCSRTTQKFASQAI